MTKKDIITLTVALVIICVCAYFGYTLLTNSGKSTQTSQNTTENENKAAKNNIPKTIDETTYKTINTLSDYGKPELSGLGKPDLFADF